MTSKQRCRDVVCRLGFLALWKACYFGQSLQNLFCFPKGDHSLNGTEFSERIYRIARIDIHEKYSVPSLYNHDIALITLDRPAIFTPFIQPACLPNIQEDVIVNRTCYATGKGSLIKKVQHSRHSQESVCIL